MNLTEFIASDCRNMWIEDDNIKVYVRKSTRFIEGEMKPFLDIASVLVDEQGKGTFTKFMTDAMCTDKNLYVESIMNPIVLRICDKLGFTTVIKPDEITPSAYLLI